MKYAAKISAEPLINDLVTSKPWQALSINNFEWKAHKYIIILDHFSHFIVVKSLDRIDSTTTIKLLLKVFAKHGIPMISSSVCTCRVQCVHCEKYHETGTPWCLGLLEYLCTPLDDKTPSPSSLICHQFKGRCPTFSSLQESQEGTLELLIERCLHEKLYHGKKSRTLADIPTGSSFYLFIYFPFRTSLTNSMKSLQ